MRRVEAGRLILGEEHQPTETPAAEDPKRPKDNGAVRRAACGPHPSPFRSWPGSAVWPRTNWGGYGSTSICAASTTRPSSGPATPSGCPTRWGGMCEWAARWRCRSAAQRRGRSWPPCTASSPQPVSVGFILQCISIGRADGYVQLVRADDTPRRMHLGGRVGAYIKEAICTMTVKRCPQGTDKARRVLGTQGAEADRDPASKMPRR